MAYRAPEPALRDTVFPGVFKPDRGVAPVVVGAIGTLLLTTAEVQPLAPRTRNPINQVLVYGNITPMGGAWKALIVALLVAASMLAVFYAWRQITVPAGVLVIIVGAGALLINLLVFHPALSLLDAMTLRIFWPEFAPLAVLPFFSCAAVVWLASARGPRDNRLASGVLIVTGAFGYLNYLQLLDQFLTDRLPTSAAPGRAIFIGLLGSGVVLIAGVMARAGNRAVGRPGPAGPADLGAVQAGHGSLLLAKAAAVAAAIAVAVATFYQFLFFSRPSAPVSLVLSVIATFTLTVIAPAALALGASRTVAGRRDPDRPFAAGVLITGGILTVLYFSYSHVFGWLFSLRGAAGWALEGSDIGVGAGVAMAAAGIALLVGGPGQWDPGPEPSLSAFPAAAPQAETDQDARGQDSRPGEPARSETTRYLCTAPHLDDRYARRVVDEVVVDPHRAVVPSLGIDMAIVLRHCFAARRRQNVRDGLIAVILIAALPVVLDYRRLTGLRLLVILLVLAGLVAFIDRWISRYLITRQLTRERFGHDDGPPITAAESAQVAQAIAAQQGDISVYGTYQPFVGSGFSRGGWSFAINLARGKESPGGKVRLEPLSFEVEEFYSEVERDITASGLAGLTVEKRLLVDGQNIRDDLRFLPDAEGRPVTDISPDKLRELTREPESLNRPYQCIRLQTWDGDLVLSVFVNFTKRGTVLLAEVQHYLLAPLQPDYRQADRLASWSLGQRLRTELRSAPRAVTATMIRAPFRITRLVLRTGMGWRTERAALRRIKADPEYNFGAMTSVRELAQARHYRRYFQQVDRDLNTKFIDRQVLDTIVDFLDSHNIDTSQFQEQRSMILNNGLLVSGGEFKAGSVAVGEQARAGMTQFTQGVQSLLRQGGDQQ
jgi:hypothetical protein